MNLKLTLMNLKNNLLELLKNKIFYLYLISFLFLFGSIFYEPLIYVVSFLAVVISIFLTVTHTIALLLFLFSFYALFIITGNFIFNLQSLYMIVFALMIFIMVVKHVILVIKKERKLNYVLLALMAVFLIYIILPIRRTDSGNFSPICSINDFLTLGCFFSLFYVIYAERKNIDFLLIVRILFVSFILSGVLGLLRPISERLQTIIGSFDYDNDLQRYCGLFQGPNSLSVYSAFLMSGVLYLFYNKKISYEAYFYFFVIFILGYASLARSFLYSFAVCFIIYIIASIVKEKKNFWKTTLPFVLEIIVACLILFNQTKSHLGRFGIDDLLHGYGNSTDLPLEDLEQIDDPGRGGLLKKYFYDFISSPLIILFGRGVSYPYLGGYAVHNFYVQIFWNIGIIGVLLFITIVLCYIYYSADTKAVEILKRAIKMISLYFLTIPFLMIFFVESMFPGIFFVMSILYYSVILNAGIRDNMNKNIEEKTEEIIQK